MGDGGAGAGIDGGGISVDDDALGVELLLLLPKSPAKGLGRREDGGGVEDRVTLVIGAETVRYAGRSGSGGLAGSVCGARGGTGREEVCEGRVNIG